VSFNFRHALKLTSHLIYGMSKITTEQVAAICTAAAQVLQEGRYADQAIERQIKAHPHWSFEEQGFVAEQIYAIVRSYRLLCALLGKTPSSSLEWEDLLGVWLILQDHPLGKQFKFLNPAQIRTAYHNIVEQRAIRESIPDWLDELGAQELGAQWEPTLKALNESPRLVLRVNLLKTDLPALQQQLQQFNILGIPLAEDAFLIQQRGKLYSTPAFQNGWFEVQDYSSQQVAPFLQVEPGMRVIDACAGNGGKALHLAALMQNKGQIIALDTDARKLEQLRLRARRAGVSIIETRLIESTKTIKRLAQSADRLLLDVPCSGLGVLRRNPDARWRLSIEQLSSLKALQLQLLESYPKMCRPSGKIVYATCSILPSENQLQVDTYLNDVATNYVVEDSKTILPQDEGFDGFFMSRFKLI
jgi:16S rRNA (cytosine967-C5)-methyltransferase